MVESLYIAMTVVIFGIVADIIYIIFFKKTH